jgi:hypothetical protein
VFCVSKSVSLIYNLDDCWSSEVQKVWHYIIFSLVVKCTLLSLMFLYSEVRNLCTLSTETSVHQCDMQ